ncbi:MAG: sulfatase-like hydrolase/transferase [bacterium]|nr:sulfatase-like hydrolase/transferase [bacterium]
MKQQNRHRIAFAAVLLLALCIADQFDLFHMTRFQLDRRDTERPGFNATVFAFTYMACIAGLVALLLHPWRFVRIISLALGGFLTAVHVGFRAVNDSGFGHHEAAILWSESAFAPDALAFFAPGYMGAVSAVAVSTVAFGFWARQAAFRRGGLVLLLLALGVAWAADRVVDRSFGKVYQAPAPVRVPLLARWAWLHSVPYYGRRDEPNLETKEPPVASHLVLVMDESISGHWLGINGGHPETTPWLGGPDSRVFNFGIASAISNLSSSTNLLLQAGLSADALPDTELRSLRDANLFAYMSGAGFRTALFDAQSYSSRPPNFMTQFDLEGIDTHRQVREVHPELPEHALDAVTIEWTVEQIESAERSFTYVLKNGAHLPYSDKFSPQIAVFHAAPGAGDLARTRTAYRNAIAWSTDRYLMELSQALEKLGREVLVVYTADHGQSLGSTNSPNARRFTPHATSVDPPSSQAAIPLLMLAFGESTRAQVRDLFVPELLDQTSQFEIFPTMLELAGYTRADATAGRAPSLFDAGTPRGDRFFVSGNIFSREGGFYILNRSMGNACFLNQFKSPTPE